MSPAWRRLLSKHKGKTLVELCRRPKIEERIAGFVVDYSESLILLSHLDWDTFTLNGYIIIRDKDIKKHRFYLKGHWRSTVFKKLKIRIQSPRKIRLGNWQEAVKDIARQYPLIHVEREIKYPYECWIGVPLDVTEQHFEIDNLDPSAKWTGSYRMKTKDVTRIDFGGGYERALAVTAPIRKRKVQRRS